MERELLAGFLTVGNSWWFQEAVEDVPPCVEVLSGEHRFSIWQQAKKGRYSLDFLVCCRSQTEGIRESFLAVEVDGHEWHERDKKQASSDRARDRILLGIGIYTARFTGSDVFRNPVGCATQSLNLAISILENR